MCVCVFLNRRLTTLNKCAAMRLEVHFQRKQVGEAGLFGSLVRLAMCDMHSQTDRYDLCHQYSVGFVTQSSQLPFFLISLLSADLICRL